MASIESFQHQLIGSVEQHAWYHGLSSKEDIAPLLTGVGDWLVRAVDSTLQASDSAMKIEIVLSVFIDNPLRIFNFHIDVDEEAKTWRLSSRKKHFREFASLAELIKYYEENDLPGGYRLKRAIPRPAWMINHNSLVYDINSNLLGEGNFCSVVKGKFLSCKGGNYLDVALKIWHEQSEMGIEDRQKARNSMMREARLVSGYMHENIVQFFGVACDRPPVIIVMELCPGGCLERHLRKQGDLITTAERIVYCLDVAKGVRYLHCKNCIHRDIACRNCLISAQGLIKLGDFGLSKLMDDLASATITMRRDEQLPVRWMAPETLCRMPQFSKRSDVWSYGILCFEIFNNGEKPWPNLDGKTIARNYRSGCIPEIPQSCPKQVVRLLRKILRQKPEARPDFGKISFLLKRILETIPTPTPDSFTLNSIEGVMRSADKCTITEQMPSMSCDELSDEQSRSIAFREFHKHRNFTSQESSQKSFKKIKQRHSRQGSRIESTKSVRNRRMLTSSDTLQGSKDRLRQNPPSRTLQNILEIQ